ncbi:hypothetical protein [Mycolicibacterium arseniciresistens]|uniref:Uncharacterized protein n=1 Tax=Mycolicibacterium arseniciresistens TaxID=3062257 RepID=A0ABT8URA7_9MYCO|nr:hypothetical protein [Mycolicibacterium arseniciresistens]MDO3638938.1 hypothetical protein [Mycolicibacterium arseniciresistens]
MAPTEATDTVNDATFLALILSALFVFVIVAVIAKEYFDNRSVKKRVNEARRRRWTGGQGDGGGCVDGGCVGGSSDCVGGGSSCGGGGGGD